MLTLYVDFKCPASYLAFRPTIELGVRCGCDVDWQPYCSRSQTIPREKANETRGETHRRVRAFQRRNTHLRYAKAQGIQMAFAESPHESRMALAALNCELVEPLSYIEAAFHAYWAEGANLDDTSTVQALLKDTGNSASTGKLQDAYTALADHQAKSEEKGIFTTPMYKLEDQLFLGREHIPLIERTLQDLACNHYVAP